MARTSPPIQPRPSVTSNSRPRVGHELHADADAEERAALAAHGFLERVAHAGHGLEAALAVGEGADAREHDAIGGAHVRGIGADW